MSLGTYQWSQARAVTTRTFSGVCKYINQLRSFVEECTCSLVCYDNVQFFCQTRQFQSFLYGIKVCIHQQNADKLYAQRAAKRDIGFGGADRNIFVKAGLPTFKAKHAKVKLLVDHSKKKKEKNSSECVHARLCRSRQPRSPKVSFQICRVWFLYCIAEILTELSFLLFKKLAHLSTRPVLSQTFLMSAGGCVELPCR